MQIRILYNILILLIIGTGQCLAQSKDSITNEITIRCPKIDSLRSYYEITMKDYDDGSVLGGQVTTVYDEKSVRLIELYTESRNIRYYFENEQLIYAVETKTIRKNQTNIDSSKVNGLGDSLNIDNYNSNTIQDLYFFKDQKLINYIVHEEKEYDRLFSKDSQIKKAMIEATAERMKSEAYKLKEKYKN